MFCFKPYRELEHTADYRLEIRGLTWKRLLQNAVSAFGDTISDATSIRAKEAQTVECRADRRDELVVALLKKVHLCFETEDFLCRRLVIHDCSPVHLTAELWGESFDPKRHPLKREVKAITYHALELRHTIFGWRARVVFDI